MEKAHRYVESYLRHSNRKTGVPAEHELEERCDVRHHARNLAPVCSHSPMMRARCSRSAGATLQRPSWGGADVGFLPFPADGSSWREHGTLTQPW
jgi:hypothetical protein